MATQFSEIVHNLTGFPTHPTEPKYYISVLRYVSSNHMVYFSQHALFLQDRSQIDNYVHSTIKYPVITIGTLWRGCGEYLDEKM